MLVTKNSKKKAAAILNFDPILNILSLLTEHSWPQKFQLLYQSIGPYNILFTPKKAKPNSQ